MRLPVAANVTALPIVSVVGKPTTEIPLLPFNLWPIRRRAGRDAGRRHGPIFAAIAQHEGLFAWGNEPDTTNEETLRRTIVEDVELLTLAETEPTTIKGCIALLENLAVYETDVWARPTFFRIARRPSQMRSAWLKNWQ